MTVKPGDTVRFLNSVGGGRVVRIANGIAYVDEDGFETPVLVNECVVITSAPKAPAPGAPVVHPHLSKDTTPEPTRLPVVETKTGDALNVVLGFEASDLKALSTASFDAYLVNDSNYYLSVSVMSRGSDSNSWTLRYHGEIEPNIQEFVFELQRSDLPDFDRVALQVMAYKRGKEFELKPIYNVELKVDTTKFAKLHCFRTNPYFDTNVIAFDIVRNDRSPKALEVDGASLAAGMQQKQREIKASDRDALRAAFSKTSKPKDTIIEVDLHAENLLDSTSGLSNADILNLQIDRFTQVMKENLRNIGQKIVFIHGKGEGVLRQALMKELTHRFKGHDVTDASFAEYGFGATQVTIRRTEPNPQQASKNKPHRK